VAERLPIVLACAGCSFAGGLAYDLAKELERRGYAEMSCLAGVAAEKPAFLRKIRNRPVWIIDGCPIACADGIFEKLGLTPAAHIRLDTNGINKNKAPETGVDMNALIAWALAQAKPAQTA
jgi:uncharacterized metal-binding protein